LTGCQSSKNYQLQTVAILLRQAEGVNFSVTISPSCEDAGIFTQISGT